LVDSSAEFFARVTELQLAEFKEKFEEIGVKTFGELAFATSFSAGSPDETKFQTELVIPVLGDEKHPKRGALRRLFTEAYSLAASDLQRRTEGRAEDAPVRLPTAEREARRAELQSRIPGVRLDGEYDPSHKLLDLAYELWDQNVIKYIAWENCTTRRQELMGVKKEPVWKPDAEGFLKVHKDDSIGKARLEDPLRLRQTLLRRGVALDLAGVIKFETHELWADLVLDVYQTDPPPGYAKVTMDMLHTADRELWNQAARVCRSGVRRNGAGALPFDEALRKCMYEPPVRMLMVPLPAAAKQGSAKDEPETSRLKRRADQLESEVRRLREAKGKGKQQYGGKGGKDGGKGGGKGKKRTRGLGALPEGLRGCASRDDQGNPLCFDFNLPHGCNMAQPGARCPRGWHKCAAKGCLKAHSFQAHA